MGIYDVTKWFQILLLSDQPFSYATLSTRSVRDTNTAVSERQEATLKRIRKKSNSIALEPANKNFETRIFGPKRITIQGKLVGIIRNY